MSMNIFSGMLVSAALVCLASSPVSAENTDVQTAAGSTLSPRQQQAIRNAFSGLHTKAEREMAMQMNDARKVAETMCRPIALEYFRERYEAADRVFLGTGKDDSLTLHGNSRLTGTGQVREGFNWHYFTFDCQLNPATGYATSFSANLTRTESFRRQSL